MEFDTYRPELGPIAQKELDVIGAWLSEVGLVEMQDKFQNNLFYMIGDKCCVADFVFIVRPRMDPDAKLELRFSTADWNSLKLSTTFTLHSKNDVRILTGWNREKLHHVVTMQYMTTFCAGCFE